MSRAAILSFLTLAISFSQNVNPGAPFEGRQFTSEQVSAAEAAIAADPDDVLDRVYLLGYYWWQAQTGGSNEVNHAARLNQLLWLVEHHPELSVFTGREGSIPDATDYEQLKQAWGQAVTTHSDDPRVLSNAAWFYRIADKQQSIDLLRRALAANPRNGKVAGQLGNEYALILAGVTQIDPSSGRASHFEPAEAGSALAHSVRAELETSMQASVLYATGGALEGYIADAKKQGSPLAELSAFSTQLVERAKAIEPAAMPQRIRVGGNVQASNLVKKIDPAYPPLAAQARVQGTVRFSVVIGKDGTVQNVQLISGHPLLVAPAVEAVKQWVYKPTLLNGVPVEVATQIDVNFTLLP